jgi:hypothetical protein
MRLEYTINKENMLREHFNQPDEEMQNYNIPMPVETQNNLLKKLNNIIREVQKTLSEDNLQTTFLNIVKFFNDFSLLYNSNLQQLKGDKQYQLKFNERLLTLEELIDKCITKELIEKYNPKKNTETNFSPEGFEKAFTDIKKMINEMILTKNISIFLGDYKKVNQVNITPEFVPMGVPRGDAEDGDAEDGDAEDGDAEDGDAEDGDAEDGDAEDGDVEDGDVEEGEDDEDGGRKHAEEVEEERRRRGERGDEERDREHGLDVEEIKDLIPEAKMKRTFLNYNSIMENPETGQLYTPTEILNIWNAMTKEERERKYGEIINKLLTDDIVPTDLKLLNMILLTNYGNIEDLKDYLINLSKMYPIRKKEEKKRIEYVEEAPLDETNIDDLDIKNNYKRRVRRLTMLLKDANILTLQKKDNNLLVTCDLPTKFINGYKILFQRFLGNFYSGSKSNYKLDKPATKGPVYNIYNQIGFIQMEVFINNILTAYASNLKIMHQTPDTIRDRINSKINEKVNYKGKTTTSFEIFLESFYITIFTYDYDKGGLAELSEPYQKNIAEAFEKMINTLED